MRSIRTRKKAYARAKAIPDKELEEYPLEYFMELFCAEIAQLPADCDSVEGLTREYLCTSQLLLPYKRCFAEAALANNTLQYRLQHINALEFPNDFLTLEETLMGEWRTRYFVNRLNKRLLKCIYLPNVTRQWKDLVQLTILLENDVITLHELDEEEEDD